VNLATNTRGEKVSMADVTVYGAPWCPDCRRSKKFLGEQRVPYDWVDIDQDPDGASFVREKNEGKQIIPTIVFPDGSFLVEPSNAELAQKLELKLKAGRSYYDLLIVGGGPAGLTTAIYAAREGIECLVIEKSALGGQAGSTERIENYPGFPEGVGGAELAEKIIAQARRYGVEMLQAVGVSDLRRMHDFLILTTDQGDEYCGRAAIVATGSSYRRLGVPGEGELIGAGIHFCATCDGPFYRGAEEIMVIGGGNSGVEEGLFLSQFADRIRVIEFAPELKASSLLQEQIRRDPKFEIHTNTEVVEFRKGEGGKLGSVVVRDRESGEIREFNPAGVFVFIGLDPNTDFLKGTVDLDQWGFVVTDDTFQTSIPGVYAAGDVRAGSTKQLASATGEGVTALLMVRQHLERVGDLATKVQA
jgi:thioredoxin reductase (NADPH)